MCVGVPYRHLSLVMAWIIDSVSFVYITLRCVFLVYRHPNTARYTFVEVIFVLVSLPFLLLRTIQGPDKSRQQTLKGLLGIIAQALKFPNCCCRVFLLFFLQGMQDLLILLNTMSALGVKEYLRLMSLSRLSPLCFTVAGL